MKLNDSQKYAIFAAKDPQYSNMFFMGVRTTGIFCRPGCPARLPKPENCQFYDTAEDALKDGFRPCKRCHPMNMPHEASQLIKQLISLVESNPERRWSEKDLKQYAIDPSTARRQFKARFGMTFRTYVRNRNLARAHNNLSQGQKVIDAQLNAGFDSPSGFRKAFSKTFGHAPQDSIKNAPPLNTQNYSMNDLSLSIKQPLSIEWLDTPLGPMIVIGDNDHLYLAEFTVRKNLTGQLEKLAQKYQRPILPGQTIVTEKTAQQIYEYFKGTRQIFDLPLITTGTDFQSQVWATLQTIPYGQTWSYAKLAAMVGNAKAVRAVASSNARNGLAIIIPCHRVINKSGRLGGYAGGLDKKQWLLDHEQRHSGQLLI